MRMILNTAQYWFITVAQMIRKAHFYYMGNRYGLFLINSGSEKILSKKILLLALS